MTDVYKGTKRYKKLLMVFDDMIAHMIGNKKHHPVMTELFIRVRKLIFFCFFILPVTKICKKKKRILFYHEGSKEIRASASSH